MIEIMSEIWTKAFENGDPRLFASGATVFRQEDPVRSMYLIRKGCVALVRVLPDGTKLTLLVAREATLLADASLFSDRYHCSGVCGADTVLAILPKNTLLQSLEHIPIIRGHLTGIILFPGAARFEERCGASVEKRNTARRQKNPARGGSEAIIGCVVLLARCAASRCSTRLPE